MRARRSVILAAGIVGGFVVLLGLWLAWQAYHVHADLARHGHRQTRIGIATEEQLHRAPSAFARWYATSALAWP